MKIFESLFFVTDEGSNIKSALSNYHRFSCCCHILATVLRHTLQLDNLSATILPMKESDDDMVYVKKLHTTISAAKSVVAYFKKTGLNNKLSMSLKQSNATGWNSSLYMLKSFSRVYNEVKTILQSKKQEQRLVGIELAVVNSLIKFLKPFKDASLALEGDHFSTLHHVFQWQLKLQRCLQKNLSDLPLIAFLKNRADHAINAKFVVNYFCLLALFFNPKFKSLRMIDIPHRQTTHQLARDLMKNLETYEATSSFLSGTSSTSAKLSCNELDHSYGNEPPQKQAEC